MPDFYGLIWSTCGAHLRSQGRRCEVFFFFVFFFLVSVAADLSSFKTTDWINSDSCPGETRASIAMIDAQQKTCVVSKMTKAQYHFRHGPALGESKAQISCIVCFFLSTLYRRHSTGPSTPINASRREWLFLKMWRRRTCQFMPLYECFGMAACSAAQCFCSSC